MQEVKCNKCGGTFGVVDDYVVDKGNCCGHGNNMPRNLVEMAKLGQAALTSQMDGWVVTACLEFPCRVCGVVDGVHVEYLHVGTGKTDAEFINFECQCEAAEYEEMDKAAEKEEAWLKSQDFNGNNR